MSLVSTWAELLKFHRVRLILFAVAVMLLLVLNPRPSISTPTGTKYWSMVGERLTELSFWKKALIGDLATTALAFCTLLILLYVGQFLGFVVRNRS